MQRVLWGVMILLSGLAMALSAPGEIAALAESQASATSTSVPATGAALKSREELEATFVTENPGVMTRVRAMRELCQRWPDRRTLELLQKVQSEIPEANRDGWLARYLHSDIPRLEAAMAERAKRAETSTAPATTRPE